MNPVQGLSGHAQLHPMVDHTNFVGATMGHHWHARTGPAQIPVRAWSNTVIGPVRDLTGHSGHARLNPVRAPAGAVIWEVTDMGGGGGPTVAGNF